MRIILSAISPLPHHFQRFRLHQADIVKQPPPFFWRYAVKIHHYRQRGIIQTRCSRHADAPLRARRNKQAHRAPIARPHPEKLRIVKIGLFKAERRQFRRIRLLFVKCPCGGRQFP